MSLRVYNVYSGYFNNREETTDSGLTVILLADFDLLQMPLEALSLLKMDCVKSVARDFSLQMLYHRMKKFIVQDEGKMRGKEKGKKENKHQKTVKKMGPDRDLNPGPLAPEARIIPLDHQASQLEIVRK